VVPEKGLTDLRIRKRQLRRVRLLPLGVIVAAGLQVFTVMRAINRDFALRAAADGANALGARRAQALGFSLIADGTDLEGAPRFAFVG